MTSLIAALAEVWPFLLAAAGVVFGLFRNQQARTTAAKAKQNEAEAEAKVSAVEKSEAEANAIAAREGAHAFKERTDVESEIAAMPDGDAAQRLRDEWSR